MTLDKIRGGNGCWIKQDDVINVLTQASTSMVLLVIIFTALSLLAPMFYDTNATEYIGHKLLFPSMVATAFIAYDHREYRRFCPPERWCDLLSRLSAALVGVHVIAFVTLFFGLELLSVSAIFTFIVALRHRRRLRRSQHVPASLGVFETMMVANLGNAISVNQLLGSLVLYRTIYHMLPLAVAVLVMLISGIEAVRGKARGLRYQPTYRSARAAAAVDHG